MPSSRQHLTSRPPLPSLPASLALTNQICGILRMAIAKGMPTTAVREESPEGSGPRLKVRRLEACSSRDGNGRRGLVQRLSTASGSGGGAAASPALGAGAGGSAGELFTDLELMEDSRAVDFSVRSFCGTGVSGSGGSCGGAPARTGNRGSMSAGACGGSAGGSTSRRAFSGTLSRGGHYSRRSRPGNYYDWFLSRLEGKEAGIIRGDIDARGKRVVPPGPSSLQGVTAAGGCGGGSQTATLAELLDMVSDMVEELDVPDDSLSKDRHTQGERKHGAWSAR